MKKTILIWLGIGLASFFLLPWHMTEDGLFDPEWMMDGVAATGLFSTLSGQWWLAPAGMALGAAIIMQFTISEPVKRAQWTLGTAVVGLVCIALQGLIIVRAGPRILEHVLTSEAMLAGQPGMGAGAGICALALLFAATISLSQSGKGQGDAFVVSTIGLIVALVAIFVFFPVIHILVRAFEVDGGYALNEFFPRFFSNDIWGLGCLFGAQSCGVGINSLFLAVMTGAGTTLLGLSFALIFTRTQFRAKKFLRVLTVLPIITPPFVIGLALILLFGRAGTVTEFFADLFGWEQTRWLYGFWGIYFAQLLSFYTDCVSCTNRRCPRSKPFHGRSVANIRR